MKTMKKYTGVLLLLSGISSTVQASGVHPAEMGQSLVKYSSLICIGLALVFGIFAFSMGLRSRKGISNNP